MGKRLTRDQAREQTRLRLVDAATLSIARKGLAATSVEDIVAQAGYTRGAFYSNFSNKSDLFFELLRRDHQDTMKGWRKLLNSVPLGEDSRKQFASMFAQCYRDENHYIIWAEARLHAIRDAKFRQRVNVLYREKRNVFAQIVERLCQDIDVKRPGAHTGYALSAMALMHSIFYLILVTPNQKSKVRGDVVWSDFLANMLQPQWPGDDLSIPDLAHCDIK